MTFTEMIDQDTGVAIDALRVVMSNEMIATTNNNQDNSTCFGFNNTDRDILSSFAFYYVKNGQLSEKQEAVLLKRIPKYEQQYRNTNTNIELV